MRECSLGVCVTAREQSLGSSLRYRQQSFLRQVWSSPSRSGWQALGLEAHHTQLLKMWVSGIKLKFSCLQGKLFTGWAIFLAQYFRCIRDNGHCWRKAFEQGDCGLLYFFPWRWLLLHTQSWLHDMVGDCMFIFPFPNSSLKENEFMLLFLLAATSVWSFAIPMSFLRHLWQEKKRGLLFVLFAEVYVKYLL